MDIKEEGIQLPMGYLSLDDCIKGWGPKGRNMFDGLIRKRFTNNDIHPPLDGHSLRSMESQPFFLTITRK